MSESVGSHLPQHQQKNPLRSATNCTVLMALRMLLSSCCPMWLEIMAQAPMETPIKRFINNPMTGALLPTAASALLPTKWPTTATSTELKSSCNKLLAASGRANSKFS